MLLEKCTEESKLRYEHRTKSPPQEWPISLALPRVHVGSSARRFCTAVQLTDHFLFFCCSPIVTADYRGFVTCIKKPTMRKAETKSCLLKMLDAPTWLPPYSCKPRIRQRYIKLRRNGLERWHRNESQKLAIILSMGYSGVWQKPST